jgi:outer membrane receptor protein involved in Fe transport
MQQDTAGAFKAVTVDNDYTDILPSANVKFDFGDGKVLRLGVAKVIARPPLDELRASRTLATGRPTPAAAAIRTLKPFEAWQLDASAEWYFRDEALVGRVLLLQGRRLLHRLEADARSPTAARPTRWPARPTAAAATSRAWN